MAAGSSANKGGALLLTPERGAENKGGVFAFTPVRQSANEGGVMTFSHAAAPRARMGTRRRVLP